MNVLPRRDRKVNRRGESTIIANLIMFVAVVGMAGAAVAIFKNLVDDSTNAATDAKTRSVGMMKTDFIITSATYSSSTEQVWVYIKNTGQQQFDPADIDAYLDGIRIPRSDSNRTILVTSDTDTVNIGVWDSGEELQLNISQTYSTPVSHTITIWTPNGVSAQSTFSS